TMFFLHILQVPCPEMYILVTIKYPQGGPGWILHALYTMRLFLKTCSTFKIAHHMNYLCWLHVLLKITSVDNIMPFLLLFFLHLTFLFVRITITWHCVSPLNLHFYFPVAITCFLYQRVASRDNNDVHGFLDKRAHRTSKLYLVFLNDFV
ncbi:hypothetical protein ACJX0J_025439, partial [Zea mays]